MFLFLYGILFLTCNVIDLSGALPISPIRKFFYGFITLFEFILFAAFLYHSISNSKAKKVIKYLSAAFTAFLIVYTALVNIKRINSVPIGIETLLILIFSFYYLFEQMNNPKTLFIYSKYQFWVLVGFMLYLSGSFFIYIFANLLPYKEVIKYWFVIDIFLIIKNVFFTTALLIFINQQKKKTPQAFSTLKAIF